MLFLRVSFSGALAAFAFSASAKIFSFNAKETFLVSAIAGIAHEESKLFNTESRSFRYGLFLSKTSLCASIKELGNLLTISLLLSAAIILANMQDVLKTKKSCGKATLFCF